MKEINEIAGSMFAYVPSTGHLNAHLLDPFFKTNPKVLHILATQLRKHVSSTSSDLIDLLKIIATTLVLSCDSCLPI